MKGERQNSNSIIIRGGLLIGLLIWVGGTIILYSGRYKGTVWNELRESFPHFTFLLHFILLLMFFGLSFAIWRSFENNRRITSDFLSSEKRFKFLLNSVSDAVWISDRESGELLYCNPAAEHFLGLGDHPVPRKATDWMERVHPEDRAVVEADISDAHSRKEHRIMFRTLDENGEIRHLLLRWNRFRDDAANQSIQGTFLTDITQLIQNEDEIKTLSRSLLSAQEEERHRIARDLHDHIGQGLASIRLQCENLGNSFSDSALPESERQDLTEGMASLVGTLIADVRNISTGLHPPELDQLGLVLTVSDFCRQFSREHSIPVEFQAAALSDIRLERASEINLFRIVQEALTNIGKHSGASRASVKMVRQGPRILLRIEDNGDGFDVLDSRENAARTRHMGIKSMEERARLLDGEFSIVSRRGSGSRILVTIPFRERT